MQRHAVHLLEPGNEILELLVRANADLEARAIGRRRHLPHHAERAEARVGCGGSQIVVEPGGAVLGGARRALLLRPRARQRLDLAIEEAGDAPPRSVVDTIFAATVFSLISEGVGVGLISPYAIAGFDQSRVVLRPFEPAVHSKSVLLLPADRPKSQLVRDFIDCLMAER
jgi:hypothetical protein